MPRLWSYARRHLRRTLWGLALLLLTNAAAMAIPQLFRIAIDGIQSGESPEQLQTVALLMLVTAVAGAGFRVLSRIHLFWAARDVEMELRCDFYRHLAAQPPTFFASHSTGDLMSRATNDLTQVRLLLGPGLLNLVNTVIAYSVAVPLMLLISVKLTLISLVLFPPALLLIRTLSRKLYLRTRQQQEAMGGIAEFGQENLGGAHVVRAYGIQAHQIARFERLNERYYRAATRLGLVQAYVWRLIGFLAGSGVLLAIWFGTRDLFRGVISLGDLVALIEYLALLTWPSFALGWVLSLWQRSAAAMTRLEQVFGVAPAIASGDLQPESVAPSIEVRDLTVEIDGRRVLDRVAFSVASGQTLGIVGPIGSGKSLLVRSLVRHVQPSGGTIRVGGHPVEQLTLDALRSVFAFVEQEPRLFSKTVAENVAFGRPEAGERELAEAVRVAALENDLAVLPHGLQTQVGERGITLSGGQKQRAAIARALLIDPPALVLDDALSSVDTETEAAILRGLRALRRGRTTLVVAHRITAVQHADRILVLDRGRVVESGSHAQLLETGGLYAKMARQQELERALSEADEEALPVGGAP